VILGIISDTHGLRRPSALAALRPCELILHAGDVGNPEILDDLMDIAPTVTVRGNVDRDGWANVLPETEMVEAAGQLIYMVHDLAELDIEPVAAGVHAVISGHSHIVLAERRENVLYLNPGSAGPRRFDLPVTVALLYVSPASIEHEILELQV
jgi:putative phosphoesterase